MGKELKMNLITAPDTLQNDNPSILLVNPSDVDKNQFNDIAKDFKSDINLYLYQEDVPEDTDQWLINAANIVDHIYVNLDNSKKLSG